MHFTKFSQLYELSLGGNGLLKLDLGNFPNTLGNFNLKWGDLSTMPNLHLYMPNISAILLKSNNISRIPTENFVGMKQLRHLDVYNNNLKTIPDLYHSSLEILEIGKNPLCCNESLCWVRLWARKKSIALKVPGKPVCSSPGYIEGELLMDSDPVEMECYKGQYEIKFIFPIIGKTKIFNPLAFLAKESFSTSIYVRLYTCRPVHPSGHTVYTVNCQTCLEHIIAPHYVENRYNHIVSWVWFIRIDSETEVIVDLEISWYS